MTSRTQQDETTKATDIIREGNAHFRVLAGGVKANGYHEYIVSLPMTAMRIGPLSGIARSFGSYGVTTKFGDDIFRSLQRMEGVLPALLSELPHVVFIYVDEETAGERAEGDFYYPSMGLPMDVCVAIEQVIRRNNGPMQRISEWLRRLI